MIMNNSIWILAINVVFSIIGYQLVIRLIPALSQMFIKANLSGIDMAKPDRKRIPEAQGVVCGAVYLIMMFLFVPVCFYQDLALRNMAQFPFHKYVEFLAALLSICCMIFLGFADDVLDLRWRHKLLLPTLASLPLLVVYFVTFNLTMIIVPSPLRCLFGYSLDIGFLYYIYMGMLAVFCTNAINIVAGINGIEAGQSLVIALSVIVFNLIELNAVCFAILKLNWYPAQVFVGDTFCYFSGMTFAVVAILGHFSKTMLLFFIPQVFNFIFSVPQLFHLVPCPRHRLPHYDPQTNLQSMSYTEYKPESLSLLARLIIQVFSALRLVDVQRGDKGMVKCSNMTIITLFLKMFGPMHESKLTSALLITQVFSSIIALMIRYPLAMLFYNQ
ncbi:hypothetical protein LSH36_4g02025 [Paralvinella palmiformis]|uniref:UDP-N-acetylglucosamine--dolichyl-phosphate N-acetylglucosaminephosphotransferase n=1 Tax=Paralvinella palmiformis TaxID=53620 RepID=A0AAD9KF89_9ANNE|nr:hypothetical protein LSH36_4g02025 [Paralvinella palmiformis]